MRKMEVGGKAKKHKHIATETEDYKSEDREGVKIMHGLH